MYPANHSFKELFPCLRMYVRIYLNIKVLYLIVVYYLVFNTLPALS